MTGLTFGFVFLVWAGGFGTGWLARMSDEYCRKGDE